MIVRERVREKEILREIRGYKSEPHEIPWGWGGGGGRGLCGLIQYKICVCIALTDSELD